MSTEWTLICQLGDIPVLGSRRVTRAGKTRTMRGCCKQAKE